MWGTKNMPGTNRASLYVYDMYVINANHEKTFLSTLHSLKRYSNLVFSAAVLPLSVLILGSASVLVPLSATLVVMVTTPTSVLLISITIPGREGSHFR